jgi:hypothetical protein
MYRHAYFGSPCGASALFVSDCADFTTLSILRPTFFSSQDSIYGAVSFVNKS